MISVAKCYIITVHSGFLDLYHMFAYVASVMDPLFHGCSWERVFCPCYVRSVILAKPVVLKIKMIENIPATSIIKAMGNSGTGLV